MPRGLKYHQTYYVPTKTTLIGLLGAAIGLEDRQLQSLFSSVKTNAILESYSGTTNDLWLITKLKTGGQPESSPIVREMLFEPQYSIYYSTNDSAEKTLDGIIDAFYDPVYPLTLGRSDEMRELKELPRKVTLESETSLLANDLYYKNTILPFNFRDYFDKYEQLPLRKGYTFNLPQVISIPISFNVEEKGIRRPSEYLQVTMLYDTGVKIHGREDGWVDEQRKFFLY
jgi:CRISPR-associated protein Cas5t